MRVYFSNSAFWLAVIAICFILFLLFGNDWVK